MRRVICKDCHTSYDFDKDEFCPKCGSFHSPGGGAGTALERELLNRFDRTVPPKCPGAAGWQDDHGGRPCGEENPPKKRGAKLALAVAALLFLAAVGFGAWYLFGREAPVEEPVVVSHDVDETFQVGKLELSIDDVRWLALAPEDRLRREGYDLLLVDVYITGGRAGSKSDPIGEAYLMLDWDWYLPAESETVLASKLKERSVYALSLADARWEDPLLGQFVFYVPRGETDATLCFEEVKAKGDARALTAIHEVALELPTREEGAE